MNRIDFSTAAYDIWWDGNDSMINVVTKLAQDHNLEIDHINEYLTPAIISRIECDARELNLLEKEDHKEESIF